MNTSILPSNLKRSGPLHHVAGVICALGFAVFFGPTAVRAQDDPLNTVHVPPPAANAAVPGGEPKGTEAPAIERLSNRPHKTVRAFYGRELWTPPRFRV